MVRGMHGRIAPTQGRAYPAAHCRIGRAHGGSRIWLDAGPFVHAAVGWPGRLDHLDIARAVPEQYGFSMLLVVPPDPTMRTSDDKR